LRTVALLALLVGFVAAALDFTSGYSLVAGGGSVMTAGDPTIFTACLLVLGAASLSVGVAAILPRMVERMKQLGIAMEVCGVAMAAVSAWAPIMGPLTDFAMLAVGGLMVLSGALMQRKTAMAPRV